MVEYYIWLSLGIVIVAIGVWKALPTLIVAITDSSHVTKCPKCGHSLRPSMWSLYGNYLPFIPGGSSEGFAVTCPKCGYTLKSGRDIPPLVSQKDGE